MQFADMHCSYDLDGLTVIRTLLFVCLANCANVAERNWHRTKAQFSASLIIIDTEYTYKDNYKKSHFYNV